ncbi:MAG: cytochrome P450 [Xanthobacteraceae bacterium]
MARAPGWVPYPGIYRARRDRERLHAILMTSSRRRENIGQSDDLMSYLINATDPETGSRMSAGRCPGNNLMTFITAGHETTALALTWTFYLAEPSSEIEARV